MFKSLRYYYKILQFNYHYAKLTTRLPYGPIMISIEPTNACNLKCPMCPQSRFAEKKIKTGFMDLELYKKIIDEAKGFAFKIALNIGGESILHKEIVEMIKIAKGAGLYVYFGTNAVTLNKDLSRKIIDSGLDKIIFEFDGKSKESYEQMRKNAKFEEVVQNITEFLKIKKEKSAETPQVVIQNLQYYDGKDSPEVCEEYKNLFKDLPVDEYESLWAHTWTGDFSENTKSIYKNPPMKNSYYPCLHIWKFFAISWDGAVFPCCLDMFRVHKIGDIKENSILEIWNNSKMVKLREMLKAKRYDEIELCKNCSMLWKDKESGIKGTLRRFLIAIFNRNYL